MSEQTVYAVIAPGIGGYGLSIRGSVAMDIIKHCALVTGHGDGEDSAGRSKIALMPSGDVAKRANEIADALVTDWEERGWVTIMDGVTSTNIYEEQETIKSEVTDRLWDRRQEVRRKA